MAGRRPLPKKRRLTIPGEARAYSRVVSARAKHVGVRSVAFADHMVEYKRLRRDDPDHEDLKAAKKMNDFAIERKKTGQKRPSRKMLGPVQRDLQQQSDQKRRRTTMLRMRNMSSTDRTAEVGRLAGANPSAVMALARQEQTFLSEQSKRTAQEAADALKWYQDTHGREHVEALERLDIVPPGSCRSIPSDEPGFQQFEILQKGAIDFAGLLVASSHAQNSSKLGKNLEAQFALDHSQVGGTLPPGLDEPPPDDGGGDADGDADELAGDGAVELGCRKAGVCLHMDVNWQAHKMRNRLYCLVKSQFSPKLPSRRLLTGSSVIVLFIGAVKGAPLAVTRRACFNIGFPVYSPYRLNFLLLDLDDNAHEREASRIQDVRDDRIYAIPTCNAFDDYRTMLQLDQNLIWSVKFYIVEETNQMVATSHCDSVPALAFRSEEFKLWNHPRKKREAAACPGLLAIEDGPVEEAPVDADEPDVEPDGLEPAVGLDLALAFAIDPFDVAQFPKALLKKNNLTHPGAHTASPNNICCFFFTKHGPKLSNGAVSFEGAVWWWGRRGDGWVGVGAQP